MRHSLSEKIQSTIKWLVPTLVLFALFYAYSESQTTQIVVIPYTNDDEEVVESLREQGVLSGNLSYAIAKLAVELGVDIEAGGFALKEKMGPFAVLAALTSPEYKYIAFHEGLRKEEVAEIVADKLNWTEEQKLEFANTFPMCALVGGEGYMFPGEYLVHKNEEPAVVRKKMQEELFAKLEEVAADTSVVNVQQAVTIASLIQREAAGKHDMPLVSGVIWNRIFADMPLQIDATLQYAKASDIAGWWPQVTAEDKYIDSPFNTYLNSGLPPGPIANPGIDAIEAAVRPADTDCLFYIHDRKRNIHCSSDYEQHKRNIEYYLK